MSKQRNVQQQNQLTFQAMLSTARRFRERGVPIGVERFLADREIDLASSAIISAQTENYMLGYDFGFGAMLVTSDKRFLQFELELDPTRSAVTVVHEFVDATPDQSPFKNNRGTGKGEQMLAFEVLEVMNRA